MHSLFLSLSLSLSCKFWFLYTSSVQDHEQALIDAIARLAYASDGESGNKYMCT